MPPENATLGARCSMDLWDWQDFRVHQRAANPNSPDLVKTWREEQSSMCYCMQGTTIEYTYCTQAILDKLLYLTGHHKNQEKQHAYVASKSTPTLLTATTSL